MFITFTLVAFLGYVSYLLISLDKFNQATPFFTIGETIKNYFEKYFFVVALSVITIVLFSYLLTLDGGNWLTEFITGNIIKSNTPFAIHITAYLIGLLNVIIVKWLYDRFKKPFKIEEEIK